MSPVAALESVGSRLESMRGSIRRLFLAEGAGRIVLGAVAFVLVTFLLDYLLVLPGYVRLTFLAAGLTGMAWLVARKVVYRLAVPIPDDELALFVERRHPELGERLLSAIQFSREAEGDVHGSPELVEALVNDAAAAAAPLDFNEVLVRRDVGRVVGKAGAAFLLTAILSIAFAEYSSVYFRRILGMNVRWPQMVRMEVQHFPEARRVIARGDDLTIKAVAVALRTGASLPSKAWVEYRFDSGETSRESMAKIGGDSFKYEFKSVTAPFRFRVLGGDDESDEYRVDLVNPPTLEEIQVFLTYPPYLKRNDTPADRPEVNGNIVAPLHTKVRFVARVSEPLAKAEMEIGPKGKEETRDLEMRVDAAGAARKVHGEFEVTEPQAEYTLLFTAQNGLGNRGTNREPVRYSIKGLVDRVPEISVVDPVGNEDISEICVRPFELNVRDDFGIQEAGFEVKLTGQRTTEWTYVPFTKEHANGVESGATAMRVLYVPGLDVAKLGAKPGDFVHVRFRATDYKDLGTRNVALSKEYRFEVIPLTELQKRLEQDIEKIRSELEKTRSREERLYDQVGRYLERGLGEKDVLDDSERGLIRESSLEQNGITTRVETAQRDIARVRRRGVYNRVFEEETARELVKAEEELSSLLGTPQKAGPSPSAAARLQDASKTRTGPARRELFRGSQTDQSEVLEGIRRAIQHLNRWSTYQEIIRMVRELWQKQTDINQSIKKPK